MNYYHHIKKHLMIITCLPGHHERVMRGCLRAQSCFMYSWLQRIPSFHFRYLKSDIPPLYRAQKRGSAAKSRSCRTLFKKLFRVLIISSFNYLLSQLTTIFFWHRKITKLRYIIHCTYSFTPPKWVNATDSQLNRQSLNCVCYFKIWQCWQLLAWLSSSLFF